jgi:hypothetical protein
LIGFMDRIYQTVGKHFVALSCVQHPADSPERTHVFSGFVIDVSGKWFYVTAGHILRDICTELASGSSFDVWRLDDQTAGNQFGGKAVPYDFNAETWRVIRDESIGLDYAATPIDDFYRHQLEAGGVIAIKRIAWGDHVTEYDHWVLMGIPSESVDANENPDITARVVLSPLTAVEEPAEAGDKVQNQFYARLDDSSEKFFKDAVGFSGGPVFALKKQGEEWKYIVIGIQSAWYPTSRILAISPFSSLGFALEELVTSELVKQES